MVRGGPDGVPASSLRAGGTGGGGRHDQCSGLAQGAGGPQHVSGEAAQAVPGEGEDEGAGGPTREDGLCSLAPATGRHQGQCRPGPSHGGDKGGVRPRPGRKESSGQAVFAGIGKSTAADHHHRARGAVDGTKQGR